MHVSSTLEQSYKLCWTIFFRVDLFLKLDEKWFHNSYWNHTPRKQILWIKETFIWYKVKEKMSELKKVLLIKKMFFNVNKSLSLDQRKFFWINNTFFYLKKFFINRVSKKQFSQCRKFKFGVPMLWMKFHLWFGLGNIFWFRLKYLSMQLNSKNLELSKFNIPILVISKV